MKRLTGRVRIRAGVQNRLLVNKVELAFGLLELGPVLGDLLLRCLSSQKNRCRVGLVCLAEPSQAHWSRRDGATEFGTFARRRPHQVLTLCDHNKNDEATWTAQTATTYGLP